MKNGDVVLHKSNANKRKAPGGHYYIYDLIGYVYRVCDNEVKVNWNYGHCEYEYIDNLIKLDMDDKDNAYSFARTFYRSDSYNCWSFPFDYIQWLNTKYSNDNPDNKYLELGNDKYPKVNFMKYTKETGLKCDRYDINARKILNGKLCLYRCALPEAYYEPSDYYYIADSESGEVYSIEYENHIFNKEMLLNFYKEKMKMIKLEIKKANMSKEELKEQLKKEKIERKETQKFIKFLTGKKEEEFYKSRIPSFKQINYIGDLTNHLYNAIKESEDDMLSYKLDKFKYNEYYEQYYLKPRKKFKDIDNNIDIGHIIDSILIIVNALNTGKDIVKYKDSVRVIEKNFIF